MLFLFSCPYVFFFFFFNDTATTEIYTLSLHDALPISERPAPVSAQQPRPQAPRPAEPHPGFMGRIFGWFKDRKSTRLNSSHGYISYAVFCLKKKKKQNRPNT